MLYTSTNKTDRHDIPEILLKVALNTINQPSDQKKRLEYVYHCYVESYARPTWQDQDRITLTLTVRNLRRKPLGYLDTLNEYETHGI